MSDKQRYTTEPSGWLAGEGNPREERKGWAVGLGEREGRGRKRVGGDELNGQPPG